MSALEHYFTIKDGTVYKHRCIDPDAIKELPSVASTPTIFMQPIVVDFKNIGEAIGEALANNDIIEVVRCENCKHWNESDCHSTVVPIARKCMCMNVYTDPDFFCKYGERREDGIRS